MIKEKELQEITSWSYNADPDFDLSVIEQLLNNNIEQYGFNVRVDHDIITGGSLFSPREYDCIKVYNPEHSMDYFYYCILLSKERMSDTISVFLAGRSSQMKMEDYMNNAKIFDGTISGSIGMGALKGGAFGVGMAVGGAAAGLAKAGIRGIGKGIAALTRDKEAVAAEEKWYAEAQELIGGTLNPA